MLRQRRRAASAVEFAIVAPVFFVFIFGLVEIGRAFMVEHQLTNAARIGCRTAIIEGESTHDITSAVNFSLTANSLSGSTTTVQGNGGPPDARTALADDETTVTVTVPTANISWIPGAKYLTGGNLTGQYTLRRE